MVILGHAGSVVISRVGQFCGGSMGLVRQGKAGRIEQGRATLGQAMHRLHSFLALLP